MLLKRLRAIPSTALGLNPLRYPRRIDVCCCGLSKTGTHSLAGMFDDYRSQHHPDVRLRLRLSVDKLTGSLESDRVRDILRSRDRKLWLEVESSALAGILIEPLVEACPDKRFILTLRDVFSWCDSWINQRINMPAFRPFSLRRFDGKSVGFERLDRIRLRGEESPSGKYDAPLTERGLPSLAAFFKLWAYHNSSVINAVPGQKLLIVETNKLMAEMARIADWVGVPPEALRQDRAWLAAAPSKHHVLEQVDPSFLQETAERYCGSLMKEYFPDTDVASFLEKSQASHRSPTS